ncbi:MAG: signal peptidase II [Eubacteriales bacterium]|nr:signal peptidase II [Eubacteriales bacterium]
MNIKQYIRNAVSVLPGIIVLIALDQITKYAAVAGLRDSGPYVILDNVLELLYIENRGAAFGIMNGMRIFFLILAPLISCVLLAGIACIPKERKYLPLKFTLSAIIAGALGNFIDRLINGYVVDFIYFMPIDFPVFNVADIYVTCGAFLLVILIMFKYSYEDLACFSFLREHF